MKKDLARAGKLSGMPKVKQPTVFPIQSYKVSHGFVEADGSKCELCVLFKTQRIRAR